MKFKALEWNKGEVAEDGTYLISAASPAGWDHYLTICFQDGEFFPSWAIEVPGSTSLSYMKALGQNFHEAKLKEMFSRWVEVD